MSIRLEGDGDLFIDSSLPGGIDVSYLFFVNRRVDRGTFSTLIHTLATDDTYGIQLTTQNNGDVLEVWSDTGAVNGIDLSPSFSLVNDEWVAIGISINADGGGDFYAKALDADGWEASVSIADMFTGSVLEDITLGRRGTSEPFNGTYAGFKIWDSEMTEAELLLESQRLTPVRLVDLHSFFPMLPNSTDRLVNYGPTGPDLQISAGATNSDEEMPPVPWGGMVHVVQPASGAGAVASSGGGSVDLPTSSGTGTSPVDSSGGGAIALPTSSGAGTSPIDSTGAGVIDLPESAGASTTPVDSSGGGSVNLPTSTGTSGSEAEINSSGGGSVDLPSSSGTSTAPVDSSGASSVDLPTSSGTASTPVDSVGGGAIDLPTSAGTSTLDQQVNSQGGGAVDLPTSAGTSTAPIASSGGGSIELPLSTGNSTAPIDSSGAGAIPLPTSTGSSGQPAANSSGGGLIILPTSSGASTAPIAAIGGGAIQLPASAGASTTPVSSSGGGDIGLPTSSGQSGEQPLPTVPLSGSFGVSVELQGAFSSR